MHEVLVNRLGGLSLPRKSVVRLTDRPDMTLDVYRGRKATMQQFLFASRGHGVGAYFFQLRPIFQGIKLLQELLIEPQSHFVKCNSPTVLWDIYDLCISEAYFTLVCQC